MGAESSFGFRRWRDSRTTSGAPGRSWGALQSALELAQALPILVAHRAFWSAPRSELEELDRAARAPESGVRLGADPKPVLFVLVAPVAHAAFARPLQKAERQRGVELHEQLRR